MLEALDPVTLRRSLLAIKSPKSEMEPRLIGSLGY